MPWLDLLSHIHIRPSAAFYHSHHGCSFYQATGTPQLPSNVYRLSSHITRLFLSWRADNASKERARALEAQNFCTWTHNWLSGTQTQSHYVFFPRCVLSPYKQYELTFISCVPRRKNNSCASSSKHIAHLSCPTVSRTCFPISNSVRWDSYHPLFVQGIFNSVW